MLTSVLREVSLLESYLLPSFLGRCRCLLALFIGYNGIDRSINLAQHLALVLDITRCQLLPEGE